MTPAFIGIAGASTKTPLGPGLLLGYAEVKGLPTSARKKELTFSRGREMKVPFWLGTS